MSTLQLCGRRKDDRCCTKCLDGTCASRRCVLGALHVESVVQAAMMEELLSQSFVRSVNDEQLHFTVFCDHDLGEWLTSKVIGEVLGVARRPDGWRFIGSLTFEGT